MLEGGKLREPFWGWRIEAEMCRTPLLACCWLMHNTREHGVRLQEIAGLLIEHGADLALCDDRGNSPCSLILESHAGLDFLQGFVYRFVDLHSLQDMTSSDAWVLAALARTLPSFEGRLKAELKSYRTPPSVSSCLRPIPDGIMELDISRQVEEVKQASTASRTAFLGAMSAKGTLTMIKPFLGAGLDLNETPRGHLRTYTRAAAQHGNLEVLMALVKAGARSGSPPSSEVDDDDSFYGPIDALLERWYSLENGWQEYFGDVASEKWVLPHLLIQEEFHAPNVLYTALKARQPAPVFRLLLDAGCGRRDGFPCPNWKHKRHGSEVIEAIKCDDPILEEFLAYGLALECEDQRGYSALLYAIDRGPGAVDYLKLLIEAGADVARRTKSGLTPLELARTNLLRDHPHRPRTTWTVNRKPLYLKSVSWEDDMASYEMLKRAVRLSGNSLIEQQSGGWMRFRFQGRWHPTSSDCSSTPLKSNKWKAKCWSLAVLVAMFAVLGVRSLASHMAAATRCVANRRGLLLLVLPTVLVVCICWSA